MLKLPFTSHMSDEILVEYSTMEVDDGMVWKITSYPHHDAMAQLNGKDTFSEENLDSFKKLGYAVCYNKLDEYGKESLHSSQ